MTDQARIHNLASTGAELVAETIRKLDGTTTCPTCYGKGLDGQDERPGIVLPANECRTCRGTGKISTGNHRPMLITVTVTHAGNILAEGYAGTDDYPEQDTDA